MDFQDILDVAFSRASKSASLVKTTKKGPKKYIFADLTRIRIVKQTIISKLQRISKDATPDLTAFEKDLLEMNLDADKVRKGLRQIRQTLKILRELCLEYEIKIKFCESRGLSNQYRKQFYGRLSSLIKKLKFSELLKVPFYLREIPRLKDYQRILLIGFPNVGKSSILKGLCGSKVEIKPYPFTTKGIAVGYFDYRYEKIQVLDTPGMLDRPFSEMNEIEKKAFTALKHTTDDIVFVIDPSETCGFSLERQEILLKSIKQKFKPKLIVVATKADLDSKKFKIDISINCFKKSDIETLKEMMIKKFLK